MRFRWFVECDNLLDADQTVSIHCYTTFRVMMLHNHPKRLIDVADLPDTLWNPKKKILQLPPILLDTWFGLLVSLGLFVDAQKEGTDGLVGGESEQATQQHLMFRFTGSVARIELAVLDPESKLQSVTDTFACNRSAE
ncbi:MAG: hypothetical protein HQM01_12800 [Magnetococcales bacterium]|nr:hypothetical protein [Magnetococcales bacterium]